MKENKAIKQLILMKKLVLASKSANSEYVKELVSVIDDKLEEYEDELSRYRMLKENDICELEDLEEIA